MGFKQKNSNNDVSIFKIHEMFRFVAHDCKKVDFKNAPIADQNEKQEVPVTSQEDTES